MRTYVRNIIMEKCNKNIRLIYYNQNHRTLHSKQHLCILHLCNFIEYMYVKRIRMRHGLRQRVAEENANFMQKIMENAYKPT